MPSAKLSADASPGAPAVDDADQLVLLATGGLGFTAAITQLVLMRELLGVFAGNELTIGIALSCWLILTALGTRIASLTSSAKSSPGIAARVCVLSLLALGQVAAVRGLRDVITTRGSALDPIATTLACLAALAPFCIGSGMLLVTACRSVAPTSRDAGGSAVYAADTAGSILGAAGFTFVLAAHLDHLAALCVTASLAFALACWIGTHRSARGFASAAAAGAILTLGVGLFGDFDAVTSRWQQHGEIVYRATSPYGRVVVSRNAGQLTFFENGLPTAHTANAAAAEELVHYALAQRPAAESVLLIGGSVAGCAREALRYRSIRRVTCVELDPSVIAAARALVPDALADPRITAIASDGRRFVQDTTARFDAILIALPEPATFQLNRFFTAEWVALARRKLSSGGVVAFGVGRYENYLSHEQRDLLASAHRTLASGFAHVTIIPGGRVFLLGSDGPLHRAIAPALERNGIQPSVVTRDYLDAMLTADRLADVDRAAVSPAPLNTDFHPVLYLLRLRQWFSEFGFPARGFALALAAAGLFALVRLAAVPRMIFAAGFAASTLEVAALVAFQVFYGSLYRQLGAVVAVFMLGLTVGAWSGRQRLSPIGGSGLPAVGLAKEGGPARPRHLVGRDRWARRIGPLALVRTFAVVIAALALVFAIVLPRLGGASGWYGAVAGQAALFALTFLLAGVVGAQFAAAAATAPADIRTAPRIFSADLVGAAFGAILVSGLLLPWLGLTGVCLATATLNLLCAALSSVTSRAA